MIKYKLPPKPKISYLQLQKPIQKERLRQAYKTADNQSFGEFYNSAQNEVPIENQQEALKQILKVYMRNGQYFISNAAAYHLGILNVRAIMVNTLPLIQVDESVLANLNNDNLLFEYVSLNKNGKPLEQENLLLTLQNMQGNYGIAVHDIVNGDLNQKLDIASSIVDEGLRINSNAKTILSTAVSLGINHDPQEILEEINNYSLGQSTSKCKVIVASLLSMQNGNGQICLGFPEKNARTAGQQYNEHCILDAVCNKIHKVPTEFVLGYCYSNDDGDLIFIKNGSHISQLSGEEQNQLTDSLCNTIKGTYFENINYYISTQNIEALNEMGNQLFNLGMDTTLIQNSIVLVAELQNQSQNQQIIRDIVQYQGESGWNPADKTKVRQLIGFDETNQKENKTSEVMER